MTTPDRQDPLAFYLDKAVPDAWRAVGAPATAARTAAEEAGLDPQRLGLLPAWRDSPEVYSELERAALELAETVTELPEQDQQQYAQVSTHPVLTDAQYAAVQWLAIVMNVTNRISILSHHPVRRRDA